ncbi:hypothetical protein EV360DRAFT_72742 [Lentinula raphanica]|nr:hypothetical protein EV360DRAFT_72742 [Lentinula raphanica]
MSSYYHPFFNAQYVLSTLPQETTSNGCPCAACVSAASARDHHTTISAWLESVPRLDHSVGRGGRNALPTDRTTPTVSFGTSFLSLSTSSSEVDPHEATDQLPTSFGSSFLSLSTSSSEVDPHEATTANGFTLPLFPHDLDSIPEHRQTEIHRLEAVYEDYFEPFGSPQERAIAQATFNLLLRKKEEEEQRAREKEAFKQQRQRALLENLVREVESQFKIAPAPTVIPSRLPPSSSRLGFQESPTSQFYTELVTKLNEVKRREDMYEAGIEPQWPPGEPTTLDFPPPDEIFRLYRVPTAQPQLRPPAPARRKRQAHHRLARLSARENRATWPPESPPAWMLPEPKFD